MADPTELVIQPPPNPILCSPYEEPSAYWFYDRGTGIPQKLGGRRPASYFYKTERSSGTGQLSFLAEEERDDLPLVNALRDDVRQWRKSDYENASQVSKTLLRHWWRADRPRRLFFCQLEAVETIIYLREILAQGKTRRGKASLTQEEFQALARAENPRPESWNPKVAQHPKLADLPAEPDLKPLMRYACKMATGSGKTVVMGMLIAWALCNRGRVPGDTKYPRHVLAVCPNLTIKERLQVLRPDVAGNYYDAFDLVPSSLRPELNKGKVLVTNWHAFNPESENSDGGKSYRVVNKGAESAEAFARLRLGDLYDGEPIMVLNDEGHHAYRPRPLDESEVNGEVAADREEATIWVSGLDKINSACGISVCVDLSATPFYIGGSGYVEGSPFPWIVSDFALVDAIESGITKIPRLPTSDTTGRIDPKFFKLWENIARDLKPGERQNGGKPKPEVVYRKAQDALLTLASQWKERLELIEAAAPGQERTPPVMILVCDNTQIADYFHKRISGEEEVRAEAVVETDDAEDEDAAPKRKKKEKPRNAYGTGDVFPALLSNTEQRTVSLRIDSTLLAEAESERPNATRKEAAEELRKIVATVGKPGEPGEHVRCVVSVNMLSEGWDANNVTQILGLRAFGSQLLCEQVVGRGLRRLDYTPDPLTGLLTPEYVDIYGVPFSLIPFKGREAGSPGIEDKPKNEVMALPERSAFEIRFPVVEGYTVALERNAIRCDIAALGRIRVSPDQTPTAVFVQPQVGYKEGSPGQYSGMKAELQTREEYYRSTHAQTIEFEISREVVRNLVANAERKISQSRAALFPQVLRIVQAYVAQKVDIPPGVDPRELGLQTYAENIVGILSAAIEPASGPKDPAIIPILNRYKPIGSSANVHFKTVKPVQATTHSHLNYVACDTSSWEQAAVFQLERLADEGIVKCYVRNDHLEFTIPYELYGFPQVYEPDFIVRLANGLSLVLEVKGMTREDTEAKHAAAQRWVRAVNTWGKLGRWGFLVCWDPQGLVEEIRKLAR